MDNNQEVSNEDYGDGIQFDSNLTKRKGKSLLKEARDTFENGMNEFFHYYVRDG